MTPPDPLQGTVIVDATNTFLPSPLDRFVRIVPVDRMHDLAPLPTPLTASQAEEVTAWMATA